MSSIAGIDSLGDIFPYLADMIVDNDEVCVETVLDSLYGYGTMHGQSLQDKVEQSPFYTKRYKKLTLKQQQLLRAGKESPECSEEDESSEEPEPKKSAAGAGAGKRKYTKKSARESPHVAVVSTTGRMFIGVVTSAKKVPSIGTARMSGFEAIIHVGQRKVNVGQYATIEDAAQAHDRALIRANGPTSCRPLGLLNFPLTFYAGDSLSKFSAFDTILKKQLFGSDWSGPKPCDFGFLMTQHGQSGAGAGKNGADFSPMDGSARKKRHKGQYSEWENSSEAGSSEAGQGQKKKLLYGNYYVMLDDGKGKANGVRGSPEESEEPYFKSPSPFDLSSSRKGVPVSAPKADDPNQPKVGDTLVVMHAEKERRAGRPAYERGVLLERTSNGGWLRIGFTDHTTRNLRGDQVFVMGTCDVHMKFMRAPQSAVTEEDLALKAYFEQRGMLVYPYRKFHAVPKPVHGAPKPAQATLPTPPTSASLPTSSVPSTAAAHFLPSEKRLQRAAEAFVQHYNAPEVVTAVLSATRPPSTVERDEDDPWSLYELADYGRPSPWNGINRATPTALTAAQGTPDVRDLTAEGGSYESSQAESAGSSSASGRARPSRFVQPRTPSSTGPQGVTRPANFHTYTSGSFGHKMNDVQGAACYVLPQELALLQHLLRSSSSGGQKSSGPSRAETPTVQGAGKLAELWSPSSEVSEHSLAGEGLLADTNAAPDPTPKETAPSDASGIAEEASAVPQPRWLRSLLTPSAAETAEVLAALRRQIVEFIASASTVPGAGALPVRLLSDCAYEGVVEVSSGCSASEDIATDTPRRYTFDLPAGNKMLVTDLGISAAVVQAGLHTSSSACASSNGTSGAGALTGLTTSADAPGVVTVGYFSSALEAALVREQVLGLNRSLFGVKNSYSVEAAANFNAAEWGELRRVSKTIGRFTKKCCLP